MGGRRLRHRQRRGLWTTRFSPTPWLAKWAKGNCVGGIMIDGAGIGSAMAANKVPGVRAAACYGHIHGQEQSRTQPCERS